jgi:hypothetical protein
VVVERGGEVVERHEVVGWRRSRAMVKQLQRRYS